VATRETRETVFFYSFRMKGMDCPKIVQKIEKGSKMGHFVPLPEFLHTPPFGTSEGLKKTFRPQDRGTALGGWKAAKRSVSESAVPRCIGDKLLKINAHL
jgi:hypothetical protein